MKIIEHRRNERTGEIVDVSWGNAITSDFSIIGSVVDIVAMKREQESCRVQKEHNPVLDYFTTLSISVVLED